MNSLSSPLPWEGEEYLKPELEDDLLLQFDIEDLCEPVEVLPSNGLNDTMVLLEQLKRAEHRARAAEAALARAQDDLQKMKQFAQDFVMSTDVRSSSSSSAIADLQEDEDGVYFSSYGHYGIHEEMLKVRKSSALHLSRTKEERWNEVGRVPVNILQSSCIFNPFCPEELFGGS